MGVRFGMGTRRAALDGLARILDAGALEDLFVGSDDDAAFLYDLLVEAARGRSSTCYWEICRTARRRGVTPEFVIDRAAVLLGSIEERRRIDAYRILCVAPLSPPETIRHAWLEFAKRGHPDVGGDLVAFRRVKDAYEMLRDPERRSEYERYWVRALGPFERVAPPEPVVRALPASEAGSGEKRLAMLMRRLGDEPRPAPPPQAAEAAPAPAAPPTPREERPASGVAEVLSQARHLVRGIDAAELAAVRARVAEEIARLAALEAELAALAAIKRRLPA